VFWAVISDQQEKPAGTLLFDFFHSHAGFDVPLSPKIYTLEETERDRIVAHVKQIKTADSDPQHHKLQPLGNPAVFLMQHKEYFCNQSNHTFVMYKTTNILHKGENHENFRNIINTPVFCHACSAKNAEKTCGGSRICEYWRVGGTAFF
jgi:hypothetical protein